MGTIYLCLGGDGRKVEMGDRPVKIKYVDEVELVVARRGFQSRPHSFIAIHLHTTSE